MLIRLIFTSLHKLSNTCPTLRVLAALFLYVRIRRWSAGKCSRVLCVSESFTFPMLVRKRKLRLSIVYVSLDGIGVYKYPCHFNARGDLLATV